MTLLPASFGAPRRGSEFPASDEADSDARTNVRVPMAMSSAMSEAKSSGSRSATSVTDLSRLSVSSDGRLYWDGKPVVVRRRLQLSFWQNLGAIIVGLAALIIALSGAVHATITAHDWMCSAKWVTNYCSPSPPPPTPDPPAQLELPN